MIQFGKLRLQDFKVDPTYVNINHGSYGVVPRTVLDYKHKLIDRIQEHPEKWFRGEEEKLLNEGRVFVAERVNCPLQNLFLVDNATEAINCLLKSMKWSEKDAVLLSNIAYISVKTTVTSLKDRYAITALELNFTENDLKSPEKMQQRVQEFVKHCPCKIKLALIDHISAIPAVVFPVKTLCSFFKSKEIPVFVDGAHAIGQVAIDLSDIQPSAYFSNFHKWAFTPKSATFLYVSDEFLSVIKPVVTGRHYKQDPSKEFFQIGTRDLTSILCVTEGFKYLESIGVDRARQYCHNLAIAGARKMAQIWRTQLFSEDERVFGNLVNVVVPSDDYILSRKIAYQIFQEGITFLPIFPFQGKVYCRLSAQIYNELSDYEFAATEFLRRLHCQSI